MRDFYRKLLTGENIEIVRSDRGIDGRRILFHSFPIRKKLSKGFGLKTVTTENMITDLGSFFYQAYVNGTIVLFLFLF